MIAKDTFSALTKLIEQMSKDKGIERSVVVDAVKQGVLLAARKKYGTYREIEAQYNEDTGEVELFEFKEVVEDDKFVDEEVEIKLSEALKLDPEAQLDDSIGTKLEMIDLGRIAAQTARQIITQKVRDAEREIIFSEFEKRKGEVASGIARRVERRSIVVDLGRTEAYIPLREQIPGEIYKPGDRIQGYIADVQQTGRGPQIVMSRASSDYLKKLFEAEVPEVAEGIIEILSVAREPGQRAKIAVQSNDSMVDPVGACVGMKGSRIQNIIQELSGEKIDIVLWNESSVRFVCNALSPAEITKVFMDEESMEMEVVVPDAQLSLAIGRKGQNVRLASKLSGWKIDITSESDAESKVADAIFNLKMISSVTDTMAQHIFQSGYSSFEEISKASEEDVQSIQGYSDEGVAQKLIDEAKALVEEYKDKEIPVRASKRKDEETGFQAGSKEEAEALLQKEMSKLDQEVTDQKVTDQEVTDQEVTDQEVTDQEVTDQEVTDQEVTDQEVTDQEVTDQKEKEEVSSEEGEGTPPSKVEDEKQS